MLGYAVMLELFNTFIYVDIYGSLLRERFHQHSFEFAKVIEYSFIQLLLEAAKKRSNMVTLFETHEWVTKLERSI